MTTDTNIFFDRIRSKEHDGVKMPEDLAALDKDNWIAEPKFDGFRLVAVVYPTTVGFFTREMKRHDGKLPHIAKELMENFPVGTVLDGEIIAARPGLGGKIEQRFEWVQSVMLSKPERAVSQQKDNDDWLTYMVFDALQFGETDLRDVVDLDRRKALEFAYMELGPWRYVQLASRMAATAQTYEHVTAMGFEGIVVKRLDSKYYDKKAWYKLKAQHDVDVLILGFTEGDGKYTGQIGAIEFGQPDEAGKLVKRGQCSGMDDATRIELSSHRESYLGKVVTVAHMGIYPNGITMRHPQFKRFRPDKPVASVVWHDR
jgi:bifunctional non-homologous end joining protein LigD